MAGYHIGVVKIDEMQWQIISINTIPQDFLKIKLKKDFINF